MASSRRRYTEGEHQAHYNVPQSSQQGSSSFQQLGGYMSELPGGGTSFICNREIMIDNMATYVTLDELPFTYGESRNLENFNRLSLQPAYSCVPSNTLKCRIMSQYYIARAALIAYFASFEGRVALTCDTWSSKQGEHYLCITVHWLDNSRFLQKRIITFDVMKESHICYNINSLICRTIDEFNLRDKVFSISFDNVTAKTECIDHIKKNVSLLLDGVLMHVRCCAHIINLSAQEGIISIAPLLTPIRNVIKWIRRSGSIKRRYKTLCKEQGLRPINFFLDTPTRWNSTYKLLCQAIKYKDIVTVLYNDCHANSETFIDDTAWRIAQQVCTLLKAYYDATDVFSLVYDPNVNLVIMECVKIVMAISDCEKTEPYLQPILFEMKAKWSSYFHEFPYVYGIASLLDPGFKSDGLTSMLEFYYQTLGIENNVKQYVDDCVSILNQLYDIYVKNCGSSSSSVFKSRRFDNDIASIIFRKPNVLNTSSSFAIDEYLSSIHETNTSDFNILSWWHEHSLRFPILSKIARDVLVIPASTVASESAFSAGRRFLGEKRSSLPPECVKICVCKKDWDQAERRQQGKKDDDEDEDDPFMIMDDFSEDTSLADSEED